MRYVRLSVGFLGLAAIGLAVGTILTPDLAARLDPGTLAENDYLFVVPLGLAAAAVVVGTLTSRTIRGVQQATPPAPEGVPTADPPGTKFDRLVGDGWRTAPAAFGNRDWLRARLREAAIRTVMRTERCSRAAACRQVDTGVWTDDSVATAFLADDPQPGSVMAAVAALMSVELPLQRRARRTAVAIERVGRGDAT